jgi:hypothetical protein
VRTSAADASKRSASGSSAPRTARTSSQVTDAWMIDRAQRVDADRLLRRVVLTPVDQHLAAKMGTRRRYTDYSGVRGLRGLSVPGRAPLVDVHSTAQGAYKPRSTALERPEISRPSDLLHQPRASPRAPPRAPHGLRAGARITVARAWGKREPRYWRHAGRLGSTGETPAFMTPRNSQPLPTGLLEPFRGESRRRGGGYLCITDERKSEG